MRENPSLVTVTLLRGNLVTWKNKKHKVVSPSSTEAKFKGLAKKMTKIIWIRKLLSELIFPQKKTCELYCDNKTAISISRNPVQHDRIKHVEIDRHFIEQKLDRKIISLSFVRSKDQLGDIITKAIASETLKN